MFRLAKSLLTFCLILIFFFSPLGAEPASPPPSADILIRDALIYDGTSFTGVRGDVAIQGDKIARIGDLKDFRADLEIDAKGLVLAPGFIDAHTHSDFNPVIYPDLHNKIDQGITTEIVGNCGMSAAPVLGLHYKYLAGVWAREGVDIPKSVPWTTFSEYRNALESKGMRNHFAALVGHGNIRSAVMGFDPRPASAGEIEEMKKLLAQALEEGAYGISFGLVYLPGVYAKNDEVVELCREAGRHVGVCAFHMRSEGAKLVESVKEVLEVARATRTPVQISHLKAGGKKNWDKIDKVFELIEAARLEGLQVASDAYPYEAGFAELGVILPDELYTREDRNAYFRDIFKREELLAKLRRHDDQKKFAWDRVMIASARDKRYRKYEGRTLKQIARRWRIEPEKFLIDILADNDFEVSAFYFSQSPEVMKRVIGKNYVAIGSDSIADGSRRPHPRAFGTFPRVFKEFVRKNKTLAMGDAVRKMTSLPAHQFGIQGRGEIKESYYADLVLFDAGDIEDRASYQKADAPNKGIRWVFLNGVPVIQNGKLIKDKYEGRFLKRSWIRYWF